MQVLPKGHAPTDLAETNPVRPSWHASLERNEQNTENAAEPVMLGLNAENREQMDYKTSRSICDAVGERLQQNLRPERSDLSPRLRELLNELRRRDEDGSDH